MGFVILSGGDIIVMSDMVSSLEFKGSLVSDFASTYTYDAILQSDGSIQQEYLKSIYMDALAQYGFKSSILSDAILGATNRQSLQSDLGSPYVYGGIVRTDINSPHEYRSSIRMDAVARVNYLQRLNKDYVGYPEYLEKINKDGSINYFNTGYTVSNVQYALNWFSSTRNDISLFTENRTSIRTDAVVRVERLLNIIKDAITPYTNKQKLNSDGTTPSERRTSTYRDTNIFNVERLSNIQPSDASIPIDWLGGLLVSSDGILPFSYESYLNIDTQVNFTNTSTLQSSSVAIAEYLSGVAGQSSSIVEILSGVGSNAGINADWTGGLLVTSDGVIPLDYLMYLAQDATLRTGYLLNVASVDATVRSEYLTSVYQDVVPNTQYMGKVNIDGSLPFSSIATVGKLAELVNEYLLNINSDGSINYTFSQNIGSSGVIPVVILSTLYGDIVIPIDWTGAVAINSDALFNFDYKKIIQINGALQGELLSTTRTTTELIFEYIQKHSSSALTSVEWTGQAATLRDTPRKIFIWKDAKMIFKRGDKKRIIN